MKLSIKIGGGFALLILIACVLGILSIYNMADIKDDSTYYRHGSFTF